MIHHVKLIKNGFSDKTIGNFGGTNIRKYGASVKTLFRILFLSLTAAVFIFLGCAKPVTPEGGPKDVDPPRVLACTPPNYSPGFTGKTFRLDFNEFVNLKNAASEILISPPMKREPDLRMRGKSLILRFEDSLARNTTYTVTFGNSLTDLTEGNILKGFRYVFSTGDHVDSLTLRGRLLTAFDRQPKKDVYVELYFDNNDTLPFDSLPMRVPPYYITRTDEQGNYIFHNLQQKPFRLFALADQNSDLVFNQPGEKIAFYDSLVTPYYIPQPVKDTTRKDSVASPAKKTAGARIVNADSVRKSDSIRTADSLALDRQLYPSYPLYLFEESDSVQKLLKSSFPAEGMAILVFRYPVRGLKVEPLNFEPSPPWALMEYSKKRDSVLVWITRPAVDTLIAKVMVADSVLDTIRLGQDLQVKPSKTGKKKGLALSASAGLSGLNQFKSDFTVTFSYPLVRWDFEKLLLIRVNDTLHPEIRFADSLKRKITIYHKWEENTPFKLFAPDSVFFGTTGLTNDSVYIDFRTRAEKDFGNLIMTMDMEKRPGRHIVQLLNEKETNVIEERTVNGSEKIRFTYLTPGRYKLKAINDRNGNGRWDTGNYGRKIQPEEVIYFPKLIEIRANWDIEETWD